MNIARELKRVVSGVLGLSLIPVLDNVPVTFTSILSQFSVTMLMLYLLTVTILGTWHVSRIIK